MKSAILTVCVLLIVLAVASTASATLATSVTEQVFMAGYNGVVSPTSPTDLCQAPGFTYTSSGNLEQYISGYTGAQGQDMCGPAYLFDGNAAYGGKYLPGGTSVSYYTTNFDPTVPNTASSYNYGSGLCDILPTVDSSVTAVFAPSAAGYDVSNITSITGNQSTRFVQAYDIAVLPHGRDGSVVTNWTNLGIVSGGQDEKTITFIDTNGDPQVYNPWNTEVGLTVTDASGGNLASGIDAVKFTFKDETEYGAEYQGSTYNEILINGTPTLAPEPGSLILLAIGLLGVIGYAWQKRN